MINEHRFDPYPGMPPDGTPQLSAAQMLCFRHAMRIIMDHRALLLNEQTGTGKTYIAAAIASALLKKQCVKTIYVFAPAHLKSNWTVVLKQFHCPFEFMSFQKISRSALPFEQHTAFCIMDEAHFLKNQNTSRYKNIQPFLYGHYLCFITATPISIHHSNLASLMLLCGFPRALADSFSHLRMFALALSPSEFGKALTLDMQHYTPVHKYIRYKTTELFDQLSSVILNTSWPVFDQNHLLSTDTQYSQLIPQMLIQRLLSHPESCRQTLIRLKNYYSSCIKYNQANPISKREFLAFFGFDAKQLPLPFVFESSTSSRPVQQSVIQYTHQRITHALHILERIQDESDYKLQFLVKTLHKLQGQVILFTQYADTAEHVAKLLSKHFLTALITSKSSQLGGHKVSRADILQFFDPDAITNIDATNIQRYIPKLLVSTDTLSAGTNLQNAATVIHLDLPWNPSTIAQREGRIARKKQSADILYFFRFSPYPLPASLRPFLNHLNKVMKHRSDLLQNWNDYIQPLPAATPVMTIHHNGFPPLWANIQDVWFPIHPRFAPRYVQYKTVNPCTIILTAFHPKSAEIHYIYDCLKQLRYHPDLSMFINDAEQFIQIITLHPVLCPDRLFLPSNPQNMMEWIHNRLQNIHPVFTITASITQ